MMSFWVALFFASTAFAGGSIGDLGNYNVQLPFDVATEALCFKNYDPHAGPWPLKQIGAKHGICQGIVSVARAFKYNASFNCQGQRISRAQAKVKLDRIMKLHARGRSEQVGIDGYCNLQEFCASNRAMLEWKATYVNAAIAISPLLGKVWAFHRGATAKTQLRNMKAVIKIRDELDAGKTPLLAVAWHVVLVTGMRVSTLWNGDHRADLTVYDPNHNDSKDIWSYVIARDFKRTIGEGAIFVISPRGR
ncbi:MAG: hypothetical protein HY074_08260 [Deltaproteobacteria bacterium]|nr:hypothetical protein [Deltaproteobacteria bacterium]